MTKRINSLILSFAVVMGIMVVGLFAQPLEAANPTFEEQFPNLVTAQAVADVFNKTVTDEIDSNDLTITNLDLGGAGLTDIRGIEIFSNLTHLTLESNQLTVLPDSIGTLTNLIWLDVASNNFVSLPDSIGDLSNLEWLYIYKNQLTSLPDTIGKLTKLKTLDAHENKLTNLPSTINGLVTMDTLSLYDNSLITLPDSLGDLNNLNRLYLTSNQITHLPNSFGQLTGLSELHVMHNLLTSLPDSFGNLSNLAYLAMDDNQLTSLPDSIIQLSNLVEFSLGGSLLPSDYAEVLNAKGMTVSGQPIVYEEQDQLDLISSPPPTIIKNKSDIDTIDYLSLLTISQGRTLSPSHNFILDGYEDETMQPVSIDTYIKNGKVIKEGKVFVRVRSIGTGVFPNNSNHAITLKTMELNFEVTQYTLSFNLNGKFGSPPSTQSLMEGAVSAPVESPVVDGLTFNGWNTSPDGTGINWLAGSTPMPANDVTLYAQWQVNTTNKIVSENQTTGKLPQTGGYGSIIISLLILGGGFITSAKGLIEKSK